MRWWCILCVSVLWRTATAKAVKEIDNVSEASSMRQCCPCPEPGQIGIPRSSFADQGFGSNLRSLAYPDQEPISTSTSGIRTSLADVDDCPCRPRDADSTGSASMFFPTAMRAVRPFVSLEDEKEESKPLLHPEVNLASSVLETLRQATDEEYEDALARDAARSVVKAMEPDGILQGVRNLIPVLVSPTQKYIDDDGEVAEASNIKETRYLNPSLTRTNSRGIPLLNPANFPLSDIFKKTTRKSALDKQLDMDSNVGASNINENVAPNSQARLDLKPKVGLLNTLPEDNILKKNRFSIPQLSDVLKNIEDTFSTKSRSSVNSDGDRIGNTNTFSKMFDTIPLLSSGSNDGANRFDEVVNSDHINSPSNLKERYSGFSVRGNSEKSNKDTDAITTLSEIRKKILETKIPQLKLKPENRDTTGDLLTDIIKSLENSRSLLPPNLFNTPSKTTAIENADIESKDFKNSIADDTKTLSTKIVDTVSSSTTPNVSAIECLSDVKDENWDNENAESDPSIKTKIIDNVPSTSDVIEIIDSNPVNTELDPVDSNEGQKISDNTSNERVITTDTEIKDHNSDETNDLDETMEDEVNDDTKHFQIDRENCSEEEDEASAASNVFRNQIVEGLADDGISSENSNLPLISTNIKEVTEDDPKLIEDKENFESKEANFQTERESCIENEDQVNAASNVISKKIIDGSADGGIASENSNVPSISSNVKAVTEDDAKAIEDKENCESTKANFQTERENFSEDEDEASAASNVFPKQIIDESAGNGMHSENSNSQSVSSNIKAVPEHDQKSIEEEENCEFSKALNGNNKKILPLKGSLLERLESLRKPKPKINQQKTTPNTKQDNDISSQLSIDDLQKMSNSLLDQEKLLIGALAERNNKNTDSNKSKGNSKPKDATVYQKTSKTENECFSDTSPEKNLDFVLDSKKTNEMMSEASETVGSALKPVTNPRSSLLSNVLQPSSLFDGSTNLFNLPTVSLSDIFRNPLPPLSMPNFVDKMESDKYDDKFTEKDAGMSSLASTSNSKSVWAPFSPLEDLNLDILQLKPLGLPQSSSLPMLPRLNLNSYKTKLAIPKSLPLKPVILESSVSNKKGMIGASMSFGKEKKKNKPKHATKNRAADILGNQIALPSFHDLQENFFENAQNLLSTPLETTSRNIIGDTFRSGQVLTENLKVKAKNVVSDLQKNFESTFKGTGTSILGNQLRSSDIFEEISRKHEDWGDKLKGIHHDFSDRLETLRNNIFDQIPRTQISRPSSNLKAIQKPSRLASRVNKNKTPPTRNRTIKKTQKPVKSKALNMLSSPSIISPKITESPKLIDNSPDLANQLASSKSELPLLNSKRLPLLDIFHKQPSLSLRNSLLKPKLKENKVKITFETTPRPVLKTYPSTTRSKPRYNSKSLLSEESSPHNSHLRGKALPLKSAYDGNESPSEIKAVHTKPPLRVPIRPKSSIKPISEFKAAPKVLKSKPASTFKPRNAGLNKSLEVSSRQTASGKPIIGNNLSKTGLSDLKSPSWPRIIDDKFLTNVREALKGRLAGLGPAKHQSASKLGKTDSRSPDMARSASNAVAVVASNVMDVVSPISESMKENTSYSCQMVCTKN